MDFLKNNFQFSHVSYNYCNLSHMDSHLYHYFCVILIDCIGFLMHLPTFGLWSSGISRIDSENYDSTRNSYKIIR